jgi:hypothetical protein
LRFDGATVRGCLALTGFSAADPAARLMVDGVGEIALAERVPYGRRTTIVDMPT